MMEINKDLIAASSTPIVLAILAEEDSYGYAILQRVRELSGGRMEWTDGMLYPVLHRLERLGHSAAVVGELGTHLVLAGRHELFGLGREHLQTQQVVVGELRLAVFDVEAPAADGTALSDDRPAHRPLPVRTLLGHDDLRRHRPRLVLCVEYAVLGEAGHARVENLGVALDQLGMSGSPQVTMPGVGSQRGAGEKVLAMSKCLSTHNTHEESASGRLYYADYLLASREPTFMRAAQSARRHAHRLSSLIRRLRRGGL